MKDLSDEQLIAAVSAGGSRAAAAFEELYDRYQAALSRFLLRMLPERESAGDTLQETFQSVLERCGTFRPDAKFSTWLYAIARNRAIDYLRRLKSRPLSAGELSDPEAGGPSLLSDLAASADEPPASAVERRDTGLAVRRALSKLPARPQEVVLLRVFEGFTFAEISQIVEAPESTVRSRFHTAIDLLRPPLERLSG